MKHFIILVIIAGAIFACDGGYLNNKNSNETSKEPSLPYLGAFKLPVNRLEMPGVTDSDGNQLYGTFKDSGAAAAYNSNNNSLFLQARSETSGYQKRFHVIAEVSIPEAVIGNIDEIPTAPIISNYEDSVSEVIETIKSSYGNRERHGIGGLMVWGDKLYGTIYRWHNCGTPIGVSHFYTSRTDFKKSNTVGPLSIDTGTLNGKSTPDGAHAGYMSKIPDHLQTNFGYKALTGSLAGSEPGGKFNRLSNGTAAIGFNPDEFTTSSQTNTEGYTSINGFQFMYYDTENPMDSSYYHKSFDINGMAFVTIMENGEQKDYIVYAVNFGNAPFFWDSGYRATSYDAKLYFFNPQDLLEVKAGIKMQYELLPQKTYCLTKHFYTNSAYRIKSMTYNPTLNHLYIVEADVNCNNEFPVVHVFSLN